MISRLDRLFWEAGVPLARSGHATSAREIAQAILQSPMEDDDAAYVTAIAAGLRDDDEEALGVTVEELYGPLARW